MNGGGYSIEGGGYVLRPRSYAFFGGGNVGIVAPSLRRFPESASEFAYRFPTLADHLTLLGLWTFQEAASPVLDKIGAHNLVENQALVYAQTGETEPTNAPRKSTGLDTTSANEFALDGAADAATFADLPAAATRTLLIRFSHPDNAGAGRGLMGAGTSGVAARWGLIMTVTTGTLGARASDGSTTVNAVSVAACDDGLMHDGALIWDPVTADTLGVLLDGAALVTAAIGALASVDVTTGLQVGACVALQGQTGMRISYAALFTGKMTAADMAVWRTAIA